MRRRRHGPGDARRASELDAVRRQGAAVPVPSRHGEPLSRHAPRTAGATWRRRAAVFGAPAAYLVALTVVTVSWGLPVARDQLFIWLIAGIAAFSVPAWRSWGRLLLEWLPFFALLVAYDYLRGAVSVTDGDAHVIPQIDFDKALFGGHVPTVWLQQHLWDASHLHWLRLRDLGRLHDALLRRVGDGRDPLARRAPALPALRGDRGAALARRLRDLLGLSGPAAMAGGRGRADGVGRPDRAHRVGPPRRRDRAVDLRERRLRQPGRRDAVAARGLPAHAAALLLVQRAAGCAWGSASTRSRWPSPSSTAASTSWPTSSPGWAMALGVHALVGVGVRRAPALFRSPP